MIPAAQAIKLARELLDAIRELTAELRAARAERERQAQPEQLLDDAMRKW